MANKRITDLTDTTTYEENDVMMVDGTNGTRKISFKALFEKTKFSGLATTAKNIIGAINELNTNKIKVKTKRYQITAVYDSNIQLYKASISIANDIPAGNILTTLITGSNSTGYAEYGPRWFLHDSNIICNAELPGTFMATVTWLYL